MLKTGGYMPEIKIDDSKCKGCYLCIEACPKKCIEISKEFSKSGYYPAKYTGADCIACQQCAKVCPDLAIEVYK
jgi:2-oxoglutarate ferredoxin oxidoreductase subunit delta